MCFCEMCGREVPEDSNGYVETENGILYCLDCDVISYRSSAYCCGDPLEPAEPYEL